jgi:hypothetical protein
MKVAISKTEKNEPIIHKVSINDLVKTVISGLEKYTKELRDLSGMKELFLTKRGNKISTIKSRTYTNSILKKFVKKSGIQDSKGNLYPLKSHQFRATFVRELIKQKVPIAYIMKQFSHVSIEMTCHYLTLEKEEVKEIYSDMIFGKDSKISGLRAKEIKSKLYEQFRGKTDQEIDNIVSNLSKSMSFNPLPTGVCLYDFRRGNCSDGDGYFFYNCPNYITEVKFYPILKQELNLMEKEMARYKELGQQRSWERQYVKYQYLKPLVDILEVQMNEEKKNQQTIEKVNKAIDKLKRSKTKKINFKTVAEEAGVSKATLYNNDILKERILSLRGIEKGIPNDSIVATPKDDKIKQLYDEIKKLKEDKKSLIIQLVEMEEIKDENKKLREQLHKLKSME